VPLLGGEAGSPSNTMWPGPRPTCTPSFMLIHPTVWPQYTNVTDRTDRQRTDSIGRTVLQTVAQKLSHPERQLNVAEQLIDGRAGARRIPLVRLQYATTNTLFQHCPHYCAQVSRTTAYDLLRPGAAAWNFCLDLRRTTFSLRLKNASTTINSLPHKFLIGCVKISRVTAAVAAGLGGGGVGPPSLTQLTLSVPGVAVNCSRCHRERDRCESTRSSAPYATIQQRGPLSSR